MTDPSFRRAEDLIFNYGRKIHLDFHTPRQIRSVGHQLDPDRFAATLAKARVNSLVMFTQCHFGLSYFPTKAGVRHPGMVVEDIFGPILDACHRRGIKVIAYHGTTESQEIGFRHGQWLQVDRDGRRVGMKSAGEPRFNFLCLNSPYVPKVLLPEVRQILETYDVDGLFMDWVRWQKNQCFCRHCLGKMKAAAVDPYDMSAHVEFNEQQVERFQGRVLGLVRSIHPDLPVYFNSLERIGMRRFVPRQSFLEVESLPAGWGLLHLPLFLRYSRSMGKPVNGMTGRFVKVWGDFGALASVDQIKSQCATMLAAGASCSIGDHLEPSCQLDPAVYKAIGEVYRFVEPRERYSFPAESRAEIALLAGRESRGLWGAGQLLLECGVPFDVIDEDTPSDRYKLLIWPEPVQIKRDVLAKLLDYVRGGGRLLCTLGGLRIPRGRAGKDLATLTGMSGLRTSKNPVEYVRLAKGRIRSGLGDMDFVIHGPHVYARPLRGTQTLGKLVHPQIDSDFYVKHQAPATEKPSPFPGMVSSRYGKGLVVTASGPLFAAYTETGDPTCRRLITNLMELAFPDRGRAVVVDGPSGLEVSVLEKDGRVYVHLLYCPRKRIRLSAHEAGAGGAAATQLFESVPPVHDITLSLHRRLGVRRARLPLSGKRLTLRQQGSRMQVMVSEVRIHEIVELIC